MVSKEFSTHKSGGKSRHHGAFLKNWDTVYTQVTMAMIGVSIGFNGPSVLHDLDDLG